MSDRVNHEGECKGSTAGFAVRTRLAATPSRAHRTRPGSRILHAGRHRRQGAWNERSSLPVLLSWSGFPSRAVSWRNRGWNNDLVESGEFVDARGLAAPVHTRRIQLQNGVPVVTDGPYPETEEVLAGYTIVECHSFDRATEIAARLAYAPYPADAPGEFMVDVRPIDEGGGDLDV